MSGQVSRHHEYEYEDEYNVDPGYDQDDEDEGHLGDDDMDTYDMVNDDRSVSYNGHYRNGPLPCKC